MMQEIQAYIWEIWHLLEREANDSQRKETNFTKVLKQKIGTENKNPQTQVETKEDERGCVHVCLSLNFQNQV